MKNCPFCKLTINDNDSRCSHCQRTLVERIEPAYTQQKTTKKTIPSDNFLKDLKYKIKNFNLNTFNVYIPIIALVILIIFISTHGRKDDVVTNINSIPTSVIPDNNSSQIPAKDPKFYVSLSNGTVLSSSSYYLNGLGQLEINNGTRMDAIAKLVNIITNKSVYTVYIKAGNVYTINKINNGNYKLYFNLGNDWDEQLKAFTVNSGYEVFEEIFDFTTQKYEEGDYIRTRYSAFEVTLNPVIGGEAKTNEINPIEFGNY